MQKSYKKNFFKIYFWNILSILLNFLSLFIVTPHISSNQVIYGIYSTCFSITFLFNYADLGFVRSGFKFANESYALEKSFDEVRYTSLAILIYSLFISFVSIFLIIASIYPNILIQNMNDYEINIASKLLLILLLNSIRSVFVKFLQIVLGVRLEQYFFDRLNNIAYLIKIASVYYFFGPDKYDIVGFFLFSQLLMFVPVFISLIFIKKKFHYNFRLFFKLFKFSTKTFNEMKKLALNALYLSILWILFYEIDLIVISRILGKSSLPYYAIGLTLLSFFRSINAIIFSPFSARFNHYYGRKEFKQLRQYFINTIILTLPLLVLPMLSVFILMKPFIFSWVGSDFYDSIIVARFLSICFIWNFISMPISLILTAKQDVKPLYRIGNINLLSFWIGVLLTSSFLGIFAFSLFKFIAFTISAVFWVYYTLKYLKWNLFEFIKKIFLPFLPSLIFLIISLIIIENFLPLEKGSLNLLMVAIIGGIASFISLILYYVFSVDFREIIKKYINLKFLK